MTLLKAFRFSDLTDSGYCNPENFLRTFARLGLNVINRENLLDYFNLYDPEHTGRINYKDFITEIFRPTELKRRKIMEKEKMNEKEKENELDKNIKKEKRKYNLTSTGFRQRIEQNLDDNQTLVKKFKDEVRSQGIGTVFEMQKSLNKLDVDNSGRIDPDEFSRLCSEHSLNLIPDEIKTLFTCFDPSRTGKIYYQDILNLISDELNDFRENLVNELFNSLKKNNLSNIDLKTMLCAFDRKKMKQEELEEYKDNFISHHDFYGKGKTDISYNEFINFFEIISAFHTTDNDFENFIKNSFNPNYEENTQEDEQKEKEKEKEEPQKEPTVLESIDKLRNEITKQGDKGVMNLLKNFRNVDLAGSNGVDIDEFISVIENVQKEPKNEENINKLSNKEIRNIFKMYDTEEKGIMEYRKFLNDLLKIKLMPESRKVHLRNIFDHLDFEHKQAIDINELISLYKMPEIPSEENILPDLLETFIIFHNILRGTRNPLVSLEDFLEYYSYINFLIPETKNDKLFIDFTAEGWRLYDKSFDERKNMIINKTGGLGLGKQKNREAMSKLIGSNKAPFGTNKEKINYNLNEEEATMKYNVNKIEDLIGHLRYILFQRGPRGIMALKRTFMLLDENADKKISFTEFEKMFKRFRFSLSQIEINNLFNFFDKDKSGFIDYSEFLNGIVGELSEFRKNILKQVFQKLDKDESGFITVKTLRDCYDPKGHPLVRQGKRTEDEILGEFIDILEYHFNLLNEKNEENEDINEIKIDFEEFCQFYKTISISVEEDKYFEIMVLSEWDIKKDGKSLYQKDWNIQEE